MVYNFPGIYSVHVLTSRIASPHTIINLQVNILLSLLSVAIHNSFPQASPFYTPFLSFVNIMVMTAGGPDNSIFRFSTEGSAERPEVPFPVVAYIIWIIYIVIMAVLFVNFLVRKSRILPTTFILFVNPRYACEVRITILAVSVCLCVCVSVCLLPLQWQHGPNLRSN